MSWLVLRGLVGCAAEPQAAPKPTFPVVHEGRVAFVGGQREPATVRLVPAFQRGPVAAEATVGATGWFRLEAEVLPGDWMVTSEVVGEPWPPESWWGVLGPLLHVGPTGDVACQLPCGEVLTHHRVIPLVSPGWLEVVTDPRPTLQWEPILGAASYQVGWIEQDPGPSRTVFRTRSGPRVTGASYTLDEDLPPGRLIEWSVFADDADGSIFGHNNGYFVTPGGERIASPLPEPPPAGRWIGVGLDTVDPPQAERGQREPGVYIRYVVPGAPAAYADLRHDDRIVQLAGEPAHDEVAVIRRIRELPPGSVLELVVERDGATRTVEVVVEARPPPER